jgi:hypothetical protein
LTAVQRRLAPGVVALALGWPQSGAAQETIDRELLAP